MLAVHRLLASRPDAAALDAFVAENTFPLTEGNSVTFVYRGEADAVELRHFIYGLESSQAFSYLPGTDFWYLVQTLPMNSRVEYKIDVIRGGDHHWIRDPLNPHLAYDPFGANSVCHCSGYSRPEWTFADPEAREGHLEVHRLHSEAFGEDRDLVVYLPARFRRQRRYPLLVVHDGNDYLRYSGFKIVLDNLIHRLEIPPMVVALTTSPRRLAEYAADPAHNRFIAEEVVPHMEETFPLLPEVRFRGLMGASFGGVATLSTAWR
ncbi:MAG: enterochelin esterase, partial [Acidobacteria bacterium]|nr:enterochelin esterase [Acidobacteriota bacterium]